MQVPASTLSDITVRNASNDDGVLHGCRNKGDLPGDGKLVSSWTNPDAKCSVKVGRSSPE